MPNSHFFKPDAEVAILSILLKNPNMIFDLRSLKSYMFSSTPNQFLYASILELLDQGLVPEINLLDSHLKSKNRDTSVGGREYLNYLVSMELSCENLLEFERIVVDSYKARMLTKLSTDLPDKISGTADIDSLIGNLRVSLDNLVESTGGQTTESMEMVLKDTWNSILERVQNPGIQGITTGSEKVDMASGGLVEGDLWIIAGRPSMGKSAVACNWMLNQAKLGIPTLLFSLEMRKELITERIISISTGIPLTNIRLGLLNQDQLNKISEIITLIKPYKIFIDPTFDANIRYVSSTIRRYVKLHGIKVVYLDYIQLLAERNADATHTLGAISRELKILSHELNVTCVVLSQLSRAVELRDNKRPLLADLRQSGNLEEDADVVIGLYRDEKYNYETKHKGILEHIFLKQRSGPIGSTFLNFDENTVSIKE
jgi:replicative DNA helicase